MTSHKAEIAIRPEFQAAKWGFPSRLAEDNIYVTLVNSSQAAALKQAVDEIARHHDLSVSEASPGRVVRIDLSFHGTRTHTIHIITPLEPRLHPHVTQGAANPRVAIILDDLGYDRAQADALMALPFPLTISVLPHLPFSTEIAEEAYRRGDQVLLHLPMESESNDAKSEAIQLRVGMNPRQVEGTLASMLESVPHAVGINNHQGSRATSDAALMAALMPALRQRGLFFIDSRTTVSTVAYDTAAKYGVHAAFRKVFLDDAQSREKILEQLDFAASVAARDGWAIAIGHPYPVTISTLAEGVPRLESHGVRLVFVSDLVN
ncbi:MAG: divergent polysaccharide deacetylase family protein [Candidatus Acidiferrales bacterium]